MILVAWVKTYTTIFLSPQITINNLSISYANNVKTLGRYINYIPNKSLSQSINYILQNLRTIIPFIKFNTAIFSLHPSFYPILITIIPVPIGTYMPPHNLIN